MPTRNKCNSVLLSVARRLFFYVYQCLQRSSASTLRLFLILLIAGYSARTIIRNRDWRTHASMWRATVKVSPLSPKAHNNMGDVNFREGNLPKAVEEFQRAIELKPNYADAYHNLAHTYQQMGRLDEAIRNYAKAVEINPRLWQSYENLGIIYFNQGLKGLAKEYLSKAQRVVPDNLEIKELLERLNTELY